MGVLDTPYARMECVFAREYQNSLVHIMILGMQASKQEIPPITK